MPIDKDREQDERIRQNAESIRRNEETLRRQTEALEKIRDHYFPKRSLWKRTCSFFLKVVGAVTVATGVMETMEWYWNTRLTDNMAKQSAAVAMQLFTREYDLPSAAKFLEKVVELNDDTPKYRIALAYVKGMAVVSELFDLGRPLTDAERKRVDEILSEAAFLREVAPEDPMSYVLSAQAYCLREEMDCALEASQRAIDIAPDNVQAHITACAMRFRKGDFDAAKLQLAVAERLDPDYPLVRHWKSVLALYVDKDVKAAKANIDALLAQSPRFAPAHLIKGMVLAVGPKPDFESARASLTTAITAAPNLTWAYVIMSDTYEREGNLLVARLWLDRALEKNPNDMKALVANARVMGKLGDWKAADAMISKAILLAPFREDLYRERAKVRMELGDAAGAADDGSIADSLVASKRSSK